MSEQQNEQLEIKHDGAIALGEIVDTDEFRQANIYMPVNNGAAFCALFPTDTDTETITEAITPLVKGDPLLAGVDVTDLVADSLMAFTIERPNFHINVEK